MAIPQLGGDEWRPLFIPANSGSHVNDHCLVQGEGGRWHIFGITKPGLDISPHQERVFCHGSSWSLEEGMFKEHGITCDFGHRAWAPTIAFNGERWIMIYGPDILRAAWSDDRRLESWHEVPCTLSGGPIGGVMRDQHILRLDDDTWLMYATGKRGRFGAVSVSVSENLLDWRFVRFVLTTDHAPKQPPWSATESPFVFKHDGEYWLSITYTDSARGPADYHDTLLFRSKNPFDFGSYGGDVDAAARLPLHAPEYVQDPASGKWYVTSCGWPGEQFGTVIPGGVGIRELEWVGE